MTAEGLSLFANLCVCTNAKHHKSKQQYLKNKIDHAKIINGVAKKEKNLVLKEFFKT